MVAVRRPSVGDGNNWTESDRVELERLGQCWDQEEEQGGGGGE